MIWDGECPKMMGMVSRYNVVTVMDIDLEQIDGHMPRNLSIYPRLMASCKYVLEGIMISHRCHSDFGGTTHFLINSWLVVWNIFYFPIYWE